MPANPMWCSPDKRFNGWAKGYLPEFSKRPSPNPSGHSGNTPKGKRKKQDRVKTQPIGWPQGRKASSTHAVERSESLGMKQCHCGGCFQKNGGWETLSK